MKAHVFVALALALPWAASTVHGDEVKLSGAGATFPVPLYNKWIGEYGKAHPGFALEYDAVGTATGFARFAEGKVDVAGTDIPMTDAELSQAQVKGQLHLPMTLGAVVPIYHLPGFKGTLRLSGPVLAEIFLGKIARWDDPQIAADNPGARLPARPIAVIHRADSSGITYVWTDFLSKASPAFREKVGVTNEPKPWPAGTGAYRNEGVAEQVKKTPGAIGYVELTHALHNKLPFAAVKNVLGEYVAGDYKSVTAAAGAVRVPSDYRVSITNASGKGAYPVSFYTFMLVSPFMEAHKAAVLRDFLKWAVTDGQKFNEGLGFARLPEAVARREVLDIASIQ